MPNHKQSAPPKESLAPDELADREEAMSRELAELAIDIAGQGKNDAVDAAAAAKQTQRALRRLVRKHVQQKNDAVLYEAIERAREGRAGALELLAEAIHEASEAIIIRRDDGVSLEVNAFVIPLFVRSVGGLRPEQAFLDEEGFALLTDSIKQAGLESPSSRVMLISHAYHLDEIDRITYSQLNEMIEEAAAAMRRKKLAAAPAIERSLSGWPDGGFAPGDVAVELRYLVGFALKRTDDPFYEVPREEAAADAWFAAREERFRAWAAAAAPLIKRCLAPDAAEFDVNFLYQDLFHGGKERGIAEYSMLQLMSDLNHGLDERGIDPGHAAAAVAPERVMADADEGAPAEMVLRVNLYDSDGELFASSEKPLGMLADIDSEMEDVYDALKTIGVTSVARAKGFDADGRPVGAQPMR
jgi:hypothetical protein